mgnify:CR=1 FL=1
MLAAERDQRAVVQRHRMLLQTQAIDEGAVGAGEIFDAELAGLDEEVRLAPRQVAELQAMLVATARERGAGLADEEREARDDDGIEAFVG